MSDKELDELEDELPVETNESEEEGLTLEEIQKEQEEIDYKNKYLQALAENENTRKRMQKEKEEMARFAIQSALEDFLSPIDNFENALSFADKMNDEVKNWAKGFEMILAQLKDSMAHHGVTPFLALGQPFDPELHEAVEVEETEDFEEGIIMAEFVRGYKCGTRVLRPAKVKVAKKVTKQEENKE